MQLSLLFVIISQVFVAKAWENTEIEMFDLIDEMNQNFYVFLGIEETATLADIKRAYRKLSLELHPDRNPDDPDAGVKFRQLAVVYQILKDDVRRQAYNDVLEHGMPDWRTPVFYYRSLRKMSNTELAGMGLLAAIAIHMATLWGYVLEQRWIMHYKLEAHLKRHKASEKRKIAIDIEITERLKEIATPGFWDILPLAIIRGVFNLLKAAPTLIKSFYRDTKEVIIQAKKEKEELKELEQQRELKKKEKAKKNFRKERVPTFDDLNSSIYQIDNLILTGDDVSAHNEEEEESTCLVPWSVDDEILLIRLTNKYPGGYPNRWKKISETMGRSASDVTSKAMAIAGKMSARMQINPDVDSVKVEEENTDETEEDYYLSKRKAKRAGIQVHATPTVSDENTYEQHSTEVPTDVGDETYVSRKKQKKTKAAAVTKEQDSSAGGNWTQAEQNELENAIKKITKGVPERWLRIAECIPSKTLPEITARIKFLQGSSKQKPTVIT